MPNESGDLKLLANFRKLIDLVSADTDYKPSNAALKPTALEAQHTAGVAAAHDVPAKFATNMTAISDREAVFADVNSFRDHFHLSGWSRANIGSTGWNHERTKTSRWRHATRLCC
jgi:hypothetical protein